MDILSLFVKRKHSLHLVNQSIQVYRSFYMTLPKRVYLSTNQKTFQRIKHSRDEESTTTVTKTKNNKDANAVTIWNGEPQFPDLIHEVHEKVGFWQTEKGQVYKDQIWTGFGRTMRLFVSPERYDNTWERAESYKFFLSAKLNNFDDILCEKHGNEWAAGYLVFRLGGALKLVTDDRWVDNHKNLRTPERKDFTIEAVDLRGTLVSYIGLMHMEKLGYIRYLNFADCPLFDNACMSRLHPVADTLEYLDISGTQVSAEGFSYFRVFPRLKWINISRLKNPNIVVKMLPFLMEILPSDCVVVCNDTRKSLAYGSPIVFRDPKNPDLDHIIEGKSGVGDVAVFQETYGADVLVLQDVSTVYELWKTPKLSPRRHQIMKQNKPRPSFLATFAKYVKNAEKYPPIL